MANVGRVEDLDGPGSWYHSLPIVTKYWFTASLGVTCVGNFGLIPIMNFIYSFEKLKSNFEVWRLVTPFAYLGVWSFPTLISLMLLVQYSKQYEGGTVYNTGGGGGTADYVFCLIFGAVCMLLSFPFLTGYIGPIFTKNLTFYVLYLWSKQNPNAPANIWGIPIKGQYLPFIYIGFNLVMGSQYMDLVHGLVIGHLFYFLVDIVPSLYGKDILHTPQFLINYFGVGAYVPPVPAPGMEQGRGGNTWTAPGRVNVPRDPAGGAGASRPGGGGGYNWGGSGRSLGTQ
jgi:Derlin-2/3